jgi:hypothetical protein
MCKVIKKLQYICHTHVDLYLAFQKLHAEGVLPGHKTEVTVLRTDEEENICFFLSVNCPNDWPNPFISIKVRAHALLRRCCPIVRV